VFAHPSAETGRAPSFLLNLNLIDGWTARRTPH